MDVGQARAACIPAAISRLLMHPVWARRRAYHRWRASRRRRGGASAGRSARLRAHQLLHQRRCRSPRRRSEGISHAYFVSGGSEAVEAAQKMAQQFFVESSQPDRRHVIAHRQSCHGNTLGALATGGNEWRRELSRELEGTGCQPWRVRGNHEPADLVVIDNDPSTRMSRSALSRATSLRSRSISSCLGFIWSLPERHAVHPPPVLAPTFAARSHASQDHGTPGQPSPPLPDQLHSLELELPAELPSLHDHPPVPVSS